MAHVREVCHSAHEIVCECWEVPVGYVPLHAELPEFVMLSVKKTVTRILISLLITFHLTIGAMVG